MLQQITEAQAREWKEALAMEARAGDPLQGLVELVQDAMPGILIWVGIGALALGVLWLWWASVHYG